MGENPLARGVRAAGRQRRKTVSILWIIIIVIVVLVVVGYFGRGRRLSRSVAARGSSRPAARPARAACSRARPPARRRAASARRRPSERARIDGAVRVAARRGADAELEVLRVGANLRAWSGLKPSWPVSTTVKPQTGAGWPSVAFGTLKVIIREIAFAWIVTSRRRAAGVDVALTEALHLDEVVPGERRRNLVVALRERRGGRGRRGAPDRARRRRPVARRAGCRRSASGRGSAAGRSRWCRRRAPGSAGCRTRPP